MATQDIDALMVAPVPKPQLPKSLAVPNDTVQTVGQMLTSIFGGLLSPAPPPTKAKSDDEASSSSAIQSYWEGGIGNAGISGGGGSLRCAVINRKAKVRDGVEIRQPGLASSAALVATLPAGTVVVVCAEAMASDGTPRAKVRTLTDSVSSPLVVGWVSSKLLRKHDPNADYGQQPDGSTDHASTRATPKDTLKDVDCGDDYECGDGPVHRLMERIRDFMAQTTFLVKEACEGDLVDILARNASRPILAEEAEGLVDSGVWRQVEAEVYVPLSARLLKAIEREVELEKVQTACRLRALRALPQTFWSIPEKMISPTSWAAAARFLNEIPVSS